MTEKRIHIVSFDVPFSPDYGGVVDVYLRAKALKKAGYHVVIHTFEYGRGHLPIDSSICDEVKYYKRRGRLASISNQPYIVQSRKNKDLLRDLLQVNDPILLEGQHCTSFIHQLKKAKKRVAVRMHNIEWQYYRELANHADSVFKKTYFRTESRRLKHHEHHLFHVPFICISLEDQLYYEQKGATTYLGTTPLFFERPIVPAKNYALFHGNLSVSENVEAVQMLIQELKHQALSLELVFAGKNPSPELSQSIESAGFTCQANLNDQQMQQLIDEASLHLCIGFQRSGLKMKLLRALESGKPVIATEAMLHGTNLESYCTVWDEQRSLANLINGNHSFTNEELQLRTEELKAKFNFEHYVKVIDKVFGY